MKAVFIFIWFACLMAVWNLCGSWISAPNTFLNILGSIVCLIFIIASVKTRCFTRKWKRELTKEKKRIEK